MNTKKMSALVIDALEDIKAKNILVLNVSKLTSLFDYIVIASGDSNRQTRALANHVREKLKAAGAHVYGSEGEDTGEWVLVDLGDIVVHIMQPVTREYYRLEELWREGKVEFPKPQKAREEDAGEKPAKAGKAAAGTAKGTAKATGKKPAAKATDGKKATTRKPAAKKPAAGKPAAGKPATKKPAGAKATSGKTTPTSTASTKKPATPRSKKVTDAG